MIRSTRDRRASTLPRFGWLAALSATVTAAQAVSISIYDPSHSGIGSLTFAQTGSVLSIATIWTSDAPSFLLVSGLVANVNYSVQHALSNQTGVAWTRVANELLDPAGQANDQSDPSPLPSFVPSGYSTSNDGDGLSFAQGQGLPRTSTVYASLQVDELSNARDFLDLYDGTLVSGATDDLMTFGLRDNDAANQPFLLSIRPNASSLPVPITPAPEPGTWALMALGLASVIVRRRRRS